MLPCCSLTVSLQIFKRFNSFPDIGTRQKHQTVFARFLGINSNSGKILCTKVLILEWQKLANFHISGQIFDKICTFWQTKNGIFGSKILWSL